MEQIEYYIVKWRTNWAWGHGSWEYSLVDKWPRTSRKDRMEHWISACHAENEWSDKYRGIDYHMCRKIPEKWKNSMIDELSRDVVRAQKKIMAIKAMEVKSA